MMCLARRKSGEDLAPDDDPVDQVGGDDHDAADHGVHDVVVAGHYDRREGRRGVDDAEHLQHRAAVAEQQHPQERRPGEVQARHRGEDVVVRQLVANVEPRGAVVLDRVDEAVHHPRRREGKQAEHHERHRKAEHDDAPVVEVPVAVAYVEAEGYGQDRRNEGDDVEPVEQRHQPLAALDGPVLDLRLPEEAAGRLEGDQRAGVLDGGVFDVRHEHLADAHEQEVAAQDDEDLSDVRKSAAPVHQPSEQICQLSRVCDVRPHCGQSHRTPETARRCIPPTAILGNYRMAGLSRSTTRTSKTNPIYCEAPWTN